MTSMQRPARQLWTSRRWLQPSNGKYVRVAARYQEDGALIAVRIWASSQFDDIWKSPEGHVLHVDTTNDVITLSNESGQAVPLTVDANTKFFFRQPADGAADAVPHRHRDRLSHGQ